MTSEAAAPSAISPQLNDAVQFLKLLDTEVKSEHKNEFIKIMTEFRRDKTPVVEVISKIKTLFTGNKALIAGFKIFLPEGHD